MSSLRADIVSVLEQYLSVDCMRVPFTREQQRAAPLGMPLYFDVERVKTKKGSTHGWKIQHPQGNEYSYGSSVFKALEHGFFQLDKLLRVVLSADWLVTCVPTILVSRCPQLYR